MNDAQYTAKKIGKFGNADLYRLSFSGTFPSDISADTPRNIAALPSLGNGVIFFSVIAQNSGGSYLGNYYNSATDKALYYIQSGYLVAVVGTASHFKSRPYVAIIDYIVNS